MISCSHCGTPNRKGSKYCGNCGQRLDVDSSMICPSCQALNPLGSAYCGACGASLAASTVAQEEGGGSQDEEPPGPGVAALSHRELPLWLYPCPDLESRISSPSASVVVPSSAEIPSEPQGGYLQDIGGILPRADAWLSSSQKRAMGSISRPGGSDSQGRKPGSR